MPIYMNGKAAQQAQPSQNVDLNNVDLNDLLAKLMSGNANGNDGKSNKDFDDKADLETIKALAKAAGTVTGISKLESNLGDQVIVDAGDKNKTLDLLKDI